MRKAVLLIIVLAVAALTYRAIKHKIHDQEYAVYLATHDRTLNMDLAIHNANEKRFEAMPAKKCKILFLGGSLTANHNWQAEFPKISLLERGISGDMSQGVLQRLSEVTRHSPETIILECGTHDLDRGDSPKVVVDSIQRLVATIHPHLPQTKIVLESLSPVNLHVAQAKHKPLPRADMNEVINQVNASLKTSKGVEYVEIHDRLLQGTEMDERFTVDGINLNSEGYKVVAFQLAPWIK